MKCYLAGSENVRYIIIAESDKSKTATLEKAIEDTGDDINDVKDLTEFDIVDGAWVAINRNAR